MTVLNVRSGENSLEFLHEEDELWIYMDKVSIENEKKKNYNTIQRDSS